MPGSLFSLQKEPGPANRLFDSVTETRPLKYQGITAGEHYLRKMDHSYGAPVLAGQAA